MKKLISFFVWFFSQQRELRIVIGGVRKSCALEINIVRVSSDMLARPRMVATLA